MTRDRQKQLWRQKQIWRMSAACLILAYLGLAYYWLHDLPPVAQLWQTQAQAEMRFYDMDGQLLARRGRNRSAPLPYAQYPTDFVHAVVAIEDKRFFRHFGFDPYAVARAAWRNWQAGSVVQGGSTLTQQLAKNVFLTPERTIKRKVQELALALWLEFTLSKTDILSLYLNRVYFGAGAYGASAAAETYFDTPVTELSLEESAILAGLLKAPTRLSARANLQAAQNRAHTVLAAMQTLGYISVMDYLKAYTKFVSLTVFDDTMQYAIDWSVPHVTDLIGQNSADLQISLTLSSQLQMQASQALRDVLRKEDAARAHIKHGAVVVLAPNGAVRALVGGSNYERGMRNRVQRLRQLGTSFTPFVYLAALEAGYRPWSRFREENIRIADWRPNRFGAPPRGVVNLRLAAAQALPAVAAQLGADIGSAHIIDVAHRVGLTHGLPRHPSIAVGAFDASVLALTNAAAHLANGGMTTGGPYIITAIDAPGQQRLYRRQAAPAQRIANARHIATLQTMLQLLPATDTHPGPQYGVTGFSQTARDGWFVGWNNALVIGVWLGNDDGTPINIDQAQALPLEIARAIWAHDSRTLTLTRHSPNAP